MKSGSQTLWELIGKPVSDKTRECVDHSEEPCWLCAGASTRGMAVSDWNGASFTGQNRVKNPTGGFVCEPCVFVTSRIAPVPGRPPKEGKTLGGSFNNFSHLVDGTNYVNASKGEKPVILAFLRGKKRGSWFAAVADSGQKHVLPWVPMNSQNAKKGVVLFDEQYVTLPEENGWTIVDDLVDLLTSGVTKESVGTGDYTAREWQLAPEQIRRFEAQHGRLRGGSWFDLAWWLSQRNEEKVAARVAAEKVANEAKRASKGKAAKPDRGSADGHPKRAPSKRSKSAESLGPAPKQDAVSGKDNSESGRVVDEHPKTPCNPSVSEPGQLALF